MNDKGAGVVCWQKANVGRSMSSSSLVITGRDVHES